MGNLSQERFSTIPGLLRGLSLNFLGGVSAEGGTADTGEGWISSAEGWKSPAKG